MYKKIIFHILTVILLSACTDKSPNSSNNEIATPQKDCIETGVYACKSGKTEPLYPFQWALNYKNSFFKAFKDIWKNDSDPENYDINVEVLHKQEIKGQGINVMVLDDGIDIKHEDLSANINKSMTFNFINNSNNPTPANSPNYQHDSHGTNVAGIIAAAQNGKGVMGIAPRVNLGGANLLSAPRNVDLDSYGGAAFSKNTDIFNASYGKNPSAPIPYDTATNTPTHIRSIVNLRNQKGAILVKSAGNEFIEFFEGANRTRDCPDQFKNILSCENPAHDIEALEPNVILVGAANAQGRKAFYSNAGPVNWITGLAGESGRGGIFGEGEDGFAYTPNERRTAVRGPSIFSTDLQGCQRGYSRSNSTDNLFARGLSIFKGIKNNPNCDYSQMGGTSAATPTVTGVVALILQVNPDLTWRDVREILLQSSRVIDKNYDLRIAANHLVDLTTGRMLTQTGTRSDIRDGMTQVPLEFGWQTNGAGFQYSNWYGFGLVNAEAAVKLAKKYKAGTLKASLKLSNFQSAFPAIETLAYGRVTKLGNISINKLETIDQFQLRLTGPICSGSVGFFVKSPSGVISNLSTPYNIYYKSNISDVIDYGLASYAFHGEKSTGSWEVFAVSGDKGACESNVSALTPLKVEYRIIPKIYS